MQLAITTQAVGGYERGDILSVKTDVHVFSAIEIASTWLASDAVAIAAGLPEEYWAPFVRTTGNFPNPARAVVQMPTFRCDMNLAEPWLEPDLTELGATRVRAKRLWFLDLDALPGGVRNSLEQPGGQAQLGANRLPAIRNKHDGLGLNASGDWTGNVTLGNTPHRHTFTAARGRLGVAG